MTKTFFRSTTNSQIAGVCGGLAQYFELDAILVRVAFVGMLFLGFLPAIVPYVLLWLLVPERPDGEA